MRFNLRLCLVELFQPVDFDFLLDCFEFRIAGDEFSFEEGHQRPGIQNFGGHIF